MFGLFKKPAVVHVVSAIEFKSRWGYHACDYETYRKLRRLNYLALLHRVAEKRHERWSRKAPQNRFERRRLYCDLTGRPAGRVLTDRPIPEPHQPFDPYTRHPQYNYVQSDPRHAIAADYRNAKTPWPNPSAVPPLHMTRSEIDQSLAKYEAWVVARN